MFSASSRVWGQSSAGSAGCIRCHAGRGLGGARTQAVVVELRSPLCRRGLISIVGAPWRAATAPGRRCWGRRWWCRSTPPHPCHAATARSPGARSRSRARRLRTTPHVRAQDAAITSGVRAGWRAGIVLPDALPAGHTVQAMHVPWISITLREPAARCRPSTFWVSTHQRLLLLERGDPGGARRWAARRSSSTRSGRRSARRSRARSPSSRRQGPPRW